MRLCFIKDEKYVPLSQMDDLVCQVWDIRPHPLQLAKPIPELRKKDNWYDQILSMVQAGMGTDWTSLIRTLQPDVESVRGTKELIDLMHYFKVENYELVYFNYHIKVVVS